jgi:hypothetical protein
VKYAPLSFQRFWTLVSLVSDVVVRAAGSLARRTEVSTLIV